MSSTSSSSSSGSTTLGMVIIGIGFLIGVCAYCAFGRKKRAPPPPVFNSTPNTTQTVPTSLPVQNSTPPLASAVYQNPPSQRPVSSYPPVVPQQVANYPKPLVQKQLVVNYPKPVVQQQQQPVYNYPTPVVQQQQQPVYNFPKPVQQPVYNYQASQQNPAYNNYAQPASYPNQQSPQINQTNSIPMTDVGSNVLNSMASTLQSSMASSLYDVRLQILKRMAGAGGVGQVYKAVYGGKEAVAKIPFEPEHERLVYEESRVMAALDHPNVVKSLAFMSDAMISIPGKEEARRTALLVEFMNLGTFSTYCKEHSQVRDNGDYSLVKSRTLDMFTQAVRGIEYMHKKEYCHLDLKPDNILIHKEKNGTLIAKVSDMGSTVKIGTEASVFQTKGFFPPESRLSRVKTDKFDIYALGAIIINIITQTPLTNYWGDTKSWEAKRSFLAQYIRNQDLLKMVMACIHDNPDERPTATEMLQQLSKLQQHDFDPVVLRIEESRIPAMKSTMPTSDTMASGSTTASSLYKYTPGSYLLSELNLPSAVRYDIFETEFKNAYGADDRFNSAAFKNMVKPTANKVTAKGLSLGLLKDLDALTHEADEESWIEEFHILLEDILHSVSK